MGKTLGYAWLGLALSVGSHPALAALGDPDPAFGIAGSTSTPVPVSGGITTVEDIYRGDSGLYYVLANVERGAFASLPQFVVVSYAADGRLDTSVNGTGMVIGPENQPFVVRGLYVDEAADKVVTVGALQFSPMQGLAFIARTNFQAQFDFSFGDSGGFTVLDPPVATTFSSEAQQILRLADGSLMVAGVAGSPTTLFIAKLSADGILDTSFGTGGYRVFARAADADGDAGGAATLSATSVGGSVTCLNGSASGGLLGGGLLGSIPAGIDVARADLVGTASPDIGEGGVQTVDLGGDARCLAARARGDGGLGLAALQGSDLVVARLLFTGALDAGFGSGGTQRAAVNLSHPVTASEVLDNGDLLVGHAMGNATVGITKLQGSAQVSSAPPLINAGSGASGGSSSGGGAMGLASLALLLALAGRAIRSRRRVRRERFVAERTGSGTR